MKTLKSIGIRSVFRISILLGAVAGLLQGSVLMIMDFTEKRFLEGGLTFVAMPILYAVLGAVVNALMAWVYNRAAARFGGIEVEFED